MMGFFKLNSFKRTILVSFVVFVFLFVGAFSLVYANEEVSNMNPLLNDSAQTKEADDNLENEPSAELKEKAKTDTDSKTRSIGASLKNDENADETNPEAPQSIGEGLEKEDTENPIIPEELLKDIKTGTSDPEDQKMVAMVVALVGALLALFMNLMKKMASMEGLQSGSLKMKFKIKAPLKNGQSIMVSGDMSGLVGKGENLKDGQNNQPNEMGDRLEESVSPNIQEGTDKDTRTDKSSEIDFGDIGKEETPEIDFGDIGKEERSKIDFGDIGKEETPEIDFGDIGKEERSKIDFGDIGKEETPDIDFGDIGKEETPDIDFGDIGKEETPQIRR
jgi:hypothetical protein